MLSNQPTNAYTHTVLLCREGNVKSTAELSRENGRIETLSLSYCPSTHMHNSLLAWCLGVWDQEPQLSAEEDCLGPVLPQVPMLAYGFKTWADL